MDGSTTRNATIVSLFHQMLADGDSANFLDKVIQQYSRGSLLRLLEGGGIYSRRAAAMALGALRPDRESIVALGKALSDPDRCVRLASDDAFHTQLMRACGPVSYSRLLVIERTFEAGKLREALQLSTRLLDAVPHFAAAHFQRATLLYSTGNASRAAAAAKRCLRLVPEHYLCWTLRGEALLRLRQPRAALRCFRVALSFKPDHEPAQLRARSTARLLDGGEPLP